MEEQPKIQQEAEKPVEIRIGRRRFIQGVIAAALGLLSASGAGAGETKTKRRPHGFGDKRNRTEKSRAEDETLNLKLGKLERFAGAKKSFFFFYTQIFQNDEEAGLICIYLKIGSEDSDAKQLYPGETPNIYNGLSHGIAVKILRDEERGEYMHPNNNENFRYGVRKTFFGKWWGNPKEPTDAIRKKIHKLVEGVENDYVD